MAGESMATRTNIVPAGQQTGYSHAAIAAALGSEILSGARAPGSRLPSVEEMHARFGVSRVVVREVTKTLTAKCLVASKTKVGTIVLDPSHWNWLDAEVLEWRVQAGLDHAFLEQIVAVRTAIEPAAAALAARHRTTRALAQLRACIEAMREAEAGDVRRRLCRCQRRQQDPAPLDLSPGRHGAGPRRRALRRRFHQGPSVADCLYRAVIISAAASCADRASPS